MKTRAFFSGFVIVALFSGLVYYSYVLAPDWMYNYLARAGDVPSWMVPLIFVFYFVAYAGGFILKFELEKLGKGFLIAAIVFFAAVSAFMPISLGERYTKVGTMEEFMSGRAVPLPKSPVGKVPGNLTLILLPLGIGLLVWSRKRRFPQ